MQITPMDLFLDDSPKASGLHKGENADVDVMDDDRTRIGNRPVGRAGRSVGDGEDNIEDRVGDKQDNRSASDGDEVGDGVDGMRDEGGYGEGDFENLLTMVPLEVPSLLPVRSQGVVHAG